MKIGDIKQKEYLVCGLGNPLLTDDGIGILLVRKLIKECDKEIQEVVDFIENQTGFMDLIDEFIGYKHVLIIDSIETLTEMPGTLILCEPSDFHGISFRSYASVHGLNFPTIMELSRVLGHFVPETCTIAGITVTECKKFSDRLSKDLKRKVPELVTILTRFIKTWITPPKEEFVHNDIRNRLGRNNMF